MKNISRGAIAAPFFGFLIGYFITHWLMQKNEIITPNILGKTLQESVVILSHNNLSVRLLHEREDAILPEGTILDQIPKPGQKVKPNQIVFVTISKKECPMIVPDFNSFQQNDTIASAEKKGILLKTFLIENDHPKGRCIAQHPQAGATFKHKQMIVYFSSGPSSLCIVPSFKNQSINDIDTFLKSNNVQAEILHEKSISEDHQCLLCTIVAQHPSAGSIIDLNRKNTIQLQVIEKKSNED
jgi:beta-lactam-binding protein with PASTA domain